MKKKNENPDKRAFEVVKNPDSIEENSLSDNSDSSEPSEKSDSSDNSENSDNSDNSDSSDNSEPSEKSDSSDSSDSSDNPDSSDNSDPSDNPDPSAPSRAFRDFKIIAEAFAKGRGIPEKDYSKVIEAVSAIGRGFAGEGISLDVFELLHKGMDYDRAVAAAASEAELKGRNAAIEESVFPKNPDDGLPHFNASHGAPKPRRSNSIFDLAREAGI